MNRKIERAKLPTPERNKRIRNIAGMVAAIATGIAVLIPVLMVPAGVVALVAGTIAGNNAMAINVADMTIDEVVKERNKLTLVKNVHGLISEDADKLAELDKRYRDEYVNH